MNARQPGIWLRVLVVVPLMEVLPLLFLGRAYLESDTQNFFLYTNMVWAFFTAVVIQCLVSIQGLAGGGRLAYIQRAQLSLGCLATLVEFAVFTCFRR